MEQKCGALQTILKASEKIRETAWNALGQRLCSLLAEAESGRLLLQLPSVCADKQAAPGTPDRCCEEQHGAF